MKRRIPVFALLLVLCAGVTYSQQITRFAVVDTARIYETFYRESRSVRDFDAKKTQYQGEIKRMSDEIVRLRQERVDAVAANDLAKSTRLENEINNKTNFLLEYSKVKNAELDSLRKKLTTDDEFYSILYDEIRKIAESDGFSMVLSLLEGTSIIWYSPTVDITEKVIRNMTSRR